MIRRRAIAALKNMKLRSPANILAGMLTSTIGAAVRALATHPLTARMVG
jgi:hypothetical protein